MKKEIRYSGYSAQPSDYDCNDGELALALDLIHHRGAVRPIAPPDVVCAVSGWVAFIHITSLFRHYIVVEYDDTDSENIVDTVSWIDSSDPSTAHAISKDYSAEDVIQVTAIGNTLIVLTTGGIYYHLWKGSNTGYQKLGSELPELSLSFGLQGALKKTEQFTFTAQRTIDGLIIPEDDQAAFSQIIMAQVNKFIADEATGAGKFIFPFFVRYAYRLFDGTLSKQSAPILMLCSTSIAPVVAADTSGKVFYGHVLGVVHDLDFAALSSSEITALGNWSDIISSVEIFVSAPIYTYDQAGKCDRMIAHASYDCGYCVSKGSFGSYTSADHAIHDLKKVYENSGLSDFNPLTCPYVDIPHHSAEEVAREVKNRAVFYHLKSVKISELSTTRAVIDVDSGLLESLVTREVMTDDYDSHDALMPGYAFSYNSRLDLANMQKRLFTGFHAGAMFAVVEDNDLTRTPNPHNVTAYFCIKQDGRDIWVQGGTRQFDTTVQAFLYLYYPNTNAYKAVLAIGTDYFEVMLEKHAFLNGAFYFGGWSTISAATARQVYSLPTVDDAGGRVVEIRNKIYVSEVGNPFYFPVLGIVTVGTGTIMGISTAAKALSQGQFGQFPLYAFSSEGVWALEVSATGTFSARQPITRDVCIDKESITQIDNAVLFASDRGIMLLSGANATCISDAIDNKGVPFTFNYPAADDILELAGLADTFSEVSFATFLHGCRMLYAYDRQLIIVFNPSYAYAYAYSLESKLWGMIRSDLATRVPSYPEALAVTSGGNLVDWSKEGSISESQLLVSRPFKLDGPDFLKTVHAIIQRGHFVKGEVKAVLYGSRNLDDWFAVASSTDHYLRGFRGTPYKYFRIALVCDLERGESLSGASVEFDLRENDQLR